MPSALVTGASGFVGFHLSKKLLDSGFSPVYVSDNHIRGKFDSDFESLINLPGAKYLKGDLRSSDYVKSLPEVDYVFHLAAFNGTQNFYQFPWDVFDNSIRPTLLLLERYAQSSSTKFVYTGTSETYADAVTHGLAAIPTTENAPAYFLELSNPRWSYAMAKTAGEVAIHSCHAQFGTTFQIIRIHNLYGPRMGFEHVIPDLIRKQLHDDGEVLGSNQSRSFLYAEDAVQLMLELALNEKADNQVINVGSSDEIIIKDLFDLLRDFTGFSGVMVDVGAPLGSVARRCPDLTKMDNLTQLKSRTDFHTGLKNTYNYIVEHPEVE
jgi:nucleoside-diphosphate-sugar epimerase